MRDGGLVYSLQDEEFPFNSLDIIADDLPITPIDGPGFNSNNIRYRMDLDDVIRVYRNFGTPEEAML